ncbi:MAG: lytic transglycosylase domain-containing protein [Burkholderiales bacterium]|nr:lytic transglycosylase domain-containing protein [Burkholderiales bacterium]
MKGLVGVLVATALMHAARVHAEVWGYVDENGKPHIATERLDERYQLYFKGPTAAELAAKAQPPAPIATSPAFERLERHPNLRRYESLIAHYAKQNDLDAALVKAVIAVESRYEPAAVSPKGAVGLMQVIPETAARYGVADDAKRTVAQKLLDPAINIRIGTQYLRDLLWLFENDLTLALAAYNAGGGAVQRYDNRIPPYAETQEYVNLVIQFYALYKPPPPPRKPARITVPKRSERK